MLQPREPLGRLLDPNAIAVRPRAPRAFLDPMTAAAVVDVMVPDGWAQACRLGVGTDRATNPRVPKSHCMPCFQSWKYASNGSSTRDRVIHGYFAVDLEIVWEIVEKELAALRRQVAAIVKPD